MFCTRCGAEIDEKDRYCHQCAHPTARTPDMPAGTNQLALPVEGKKIAGVCAGFARYLGVDVTLVRVVWLSTALLTGVGFIAYLVAWLIMPKESVSKVVSTTEAAQHS